MAAPSVQASFLKSSSNHLLEKNEKSAQALFFVRFSSIVIQCYPCDLLSVLVNAVLSLMLENVVRAFLFIFVLVALCMIAVAMLGFGEVIDDFLTTQIPTRYQILANSDAYIRLLSYGLVILSVPVLFYVIIRISGVRESRRERIEREKQAIQNLNKYQQAFRQRMKKY